MLEFAAKDCVFHFNKKHLQDQTIPMWVLKFRGETYYVNHVDCNIPWSTKETPENSHTKGSIKVKDCLIQIDDNNCAIISPLTKDAAARIRNKELGITRVIVPEESYHDFANALSTGNIKHKPIKSFGGNCSKCFYVTDIFNQQDVTYLTIAASGVRILKPNESYYKLYDDDSYDDSIDYEDFYEE